MTTWNASPEKMESHWLPFMDNKTFKTDPRVVTRASGVELWNHRGERVLDAASGLFTTPAGHCREEIADAVSAQLRNLDYMPSFLRGHPGSFEAADRLVSILPNGLDHVFFCNSGSESVDTAMKMALAYHNARGEGSRDVFVSRERAYHGVNLGGTALAGIVRNRQDYSVGLPTVVHMRSTWSEDARFTPGQAPGGADLADDLLRAVKLHGPKRIAACFVEPIAGSTGVLVPPEDYLPRLRAICDEYGILLVFDEVITGFGRTGAPFGAHAFDVKPDIMTMAKALTNGAIPMGAVACRSDIYQTCLDAYGDHVVEFAHGYTYSAHPVACAAAIATLSLYEHERLFDRAAELSPKFQEKMFSLSNVPGVTDVRGYGMLAGIDVETKGAPGARGHLLQRMLFDAGLHLKTTGDAAIVAPAFVMTDDQLEEMTDILRDTLKRLAAA